MPFKPNNLFCYETKEMSIRQRKGLKINSLFIYAVNQQHPKIKEKNEEQCEMEKNREYETNILQKYL